MPAMIRGNKKAQKIAYDILGTPANIKDKKSAFQKEIDKRIVYQSTYRFR